MRLRCCQSSRRWSSPTCSSPSRPRAAHSGRSSRAQFKYRWRSHSTLSCRRASSCTGCQTRSGACAGLRRPPHQRLAPARITPPSPQPRDADSVVRLRARQLPLPRPSPPRTGCTHCARCDCDVSRTRRTRCRRACRDACRAAPRRPPRRPRRPPLRPMPRWWRCVSIARPRRAVTSSRGWWRTCG